MSYHRKGSNSSLASTNSAISAVMNTKNNCIYKKEILSAIQKIPIQINKDIVKSFIKKDNNFSISEKKDRPIRITPIKNSILNQKTTSSKKDKNLNIEDVIYSLEDLFKQIKDKFSNGKNCVYECKEWIEILNDYIELILDKIEANEYMPLISVCINIIFVSVIIICNLSDNGKYNLFKYDTNKIFENCNSLNEIIYKRCRNKNDIDLKIKSNDMTNLYKRITNSLNTIFSKYEQFIPSISKDFDNLMKNIRRISFIELYNFYVDYIKYPKKVKEFHLDNDNKNKNNQMFQSYKSFTNPNKNNHSKEVRGLSVDYVNPNINKNQYNQNKINSYKKINSDNLTNLNITDINNNINNINSLPTNKLIRGFSQDHHLKNNLTFTNFNINPTFQYPFNGKIYNTIQGTSYNNNGNNIMIYDKMNNQNDNNIKYIPTTPQVNNIIYSSNTQIPKNKINYYELNDNKNSEFKSMISYNFPSNNNNNTKYLNSNTFDIKTIKNNILNKYSKPITLPIIPYPRNKEFTLLIHLDETLIYTSKKTNRIILRNGLIDFIKTIKPFYELISFTYGNQKYSDQIINLIERKEKYFDYCLYKENASYLNENYYKDFNKLGRDIRKTIIIDDQDNNLGKNENDNTILIKSFNEESYKNPKDYILNNLSTILISVAKKENDDVRKFLRMIKKEIDVKVSGN